LPDTVGVLPGHGPQTTMARERVGNPYLQDLAELPLRPRRGRPDSPPAAPRPADNKE